MISKVLFICLFDEAFTRNLSSTTIVLNLYRGHGSIRKELNAKTPFNAIEIWNTLKREIFTITPDEFKNKIQIETEIYSIHINNVVKATLMFM